MGNTSSTQSNATNDPERHSTPTSTPEHVVLIPLDSLIGYPPPGNSLLQASSNLLNNMLPIATITPCEPVFRTGMSLFSIENKSEDYNKLMAKLGYKIEAPIRLAFLPDSPPVDTLTNDYEESFLNKMNDFVSGSVGQVAQMFGARSASEGMKNIAETVRQAPGAIGTLAGGAADLAAGAGSMIGKLAENMGVSKNTTDLANKLLAGARIDFPFVWRNSSFSSSISITVRLYNPVPSNDDLQEKLIIGPLIAILSLATPISDHMNVYSWPYLHKVKCRGLFNIEPATITNISITRGADGQISYRQRPSLIDVKIDFGNLHSVMINSTVPEAANRPSVLQYRNTLKEQRKILSLKPGETAITTSSNVKVVSIPNENNINTVKNKALPKTPGIIEKTIEAGTAIVNRVASTVTEAASKVLKAIKEFPVPEKEMYDRTDAENIAKLKVYKKGTMEGDYFFNGNTGMLYEAGKPPMFVGETPGQKILQVLK